MITTKIEDIVITMTTNLQISFYEPIDNEILTFPNDYKKEVTDRLDKYSELQPTFRNRLDVVKNFMNSEDQTYLIPQFVAYHNKKDMQRNQTTVKVFSELSSIFS